MVNNNGMFHFWCFNDPHLEKQKKIKLPIFNNIKI